MRLRPIGWLFLPLILVGCGGGDKPATTLSVSCHGSDALDGARSIDVLGDQVNGHTVLSFPDPVRRGMTSTLTVGPGDRCTIIPGNGSDN